MSYKKLRVIDDKCLEKFKKESKCCIIIKDLVYDVTSFFDHPGGYDVFKDYAGKDTTEAFAQIGHSINAQKLMKTYLIGIKKNSPLYEQNINTKSVNGKIEYIDYFLEEIKEKEPPKIDILEINKKEENTNYMLVAGIIAGFSIAYYFMFLK
ncbi:cytochrome b5, putative [Plasmodium berghei]|uniref:Cytochrome b5, putative n=2 Tax=Plasmodium berghei TaxID=5821 RepID=A0A509AVV1_PLABA|nr:cytochrome b5, putative [Plasmodium berghei ANKA]CXJ24678.1 cytochrome b5, putative [Plasmodium berghei]SCM26810.1 cytochrome b5, putative [Plasmodium berghei]SCN28650.1 cytochrome b5, putative [Plasmodium berghei]SCO62863.1 cytochrome b5, putative [Plasmodium berghei]SCO64398.1 cytochrome b5, putative [Plasmodium berghei]|eukprot:XP_034424294.1 cytochrome b5, putative [Plasmodium berghei ANKA]